ncbi:toll/interleukin-1 receptor domain-containing protein [Duganella sp. Dugasp56]|uniref:toll/interleukin-1 receptor domain-containing protein n=1 Tax=Duganella sp. Dugasp56 TaxID=3243046 RepID=UPI0039AEC986
MTSSTTVPEGSVFVSYAWGGALAHKEWLRDHIIRYLDLSNFSVFWDRDNILFGQSIDQIIRNALAVRPLHVVCICDRDFLDSAQRANSGLARELKMVADIAGHDGVRILPVILDAECSTSLPEVLADRMYLDLTTLHSRQLRIGNVLCAALLGASQTQVAAMIGHQIEIANLRSRAERYFAGREPSFDGNALNHVVKLSDGNLLLPPAWMYQVSRWSFRLNDDVPGFSPQKGIWHWDHWSASTGMRGLGAAIMSALFPPKISDEDIYAIELCGDILAVAIISMTKKTEHLRLDWREIIQCVLMSDGGMKALDRLLPETTVDAIE